jgi:hypothetical protein
MMSPTGNSSFDATLIAAEAVRQQAIAISTTQAQMNTASVVFYRALLASAVANSIDAGEFIGALQEQLGVTV